MRSLGFTLTAVLIVSMLGIGTCLAAGWRIDTAALLVSAAVAVIASVLSLAPGYLVRGGDQSAAVQAALIGSLVHMGTFALAAGVVLIGRVNIGQSFVYWLFAFYFATLIAVVAGLVRMIQAAPPAGKRS